MTILKRMGVTVNREFQLEGSLNGITYDEFTPCCANDSYENNLLKKQKGCYLYG